MSFLGLLLGCRQLAAEKKMQISLVDTASYLRRLEILHRCSNTSDEIRKSRHGENVCYSIQFDSLGQGS
jgi:hypothetical protein